MALQDILTRSPDDIVILSAKRTPLCRAKMGGLKDSKFEDLLSTSLRAVLHEGGVPADKVEEVCIGTVRTPRGGASISRMAAIHAGITTKSTVSTVNRQCSSGLQAVWNVALSIKNGDIDIGIGGGAECMTMHYNTKVVEHEVSEDVMSTKAAADCLIPMGITNENVATLYSIPRSSQDAFAASSYSKAEKAQKTGFFAEEIAPVLVRSKKKGEDGKVVRVESKVEADDGIRYGVTAESLSTIKPAFKKDGSTHAGNASQLTDGAAAVLLARRSVAEAMGLGDRIKGKVVRVTGVGVPPHIMGVGPAFAIPKLLEKEGLGIGDVDFFEYYLVCRPIASKATSSLRHTRKNQHPNLGLPWEEQDDGLATTLSSPHPPSSSQGKKGLAMEKSAPFP
ncbi:hypothetical protein BT69DRAFT_1349555 [Atractiella rhizophila]|nr:hypothetical protein BT69DRAFT_1349555 [Atractiella rhizophila]